MQNFNLTPYNHYIFIGTLILTLFCFILLGIKALNLVNSIQELTPNIEKITKDIEITGAKIKLLEKDDNKKSLSPYVKAALPIILAIRKAYKKDDKKKGVKGYAEATAQVVNRRNTQNLLIEELKNIFIR